MKKNPIIREVPRRQLAVLRIRGRATASGAECRFYRSHKTARKGFKVYLSLPEARSAFTRQKRAYKRGLGPKPGRLFVSVMNKNRRELWYGYETQIAKPVTETFFDRHCDELERKLRKLGIKPCDLYRWNCGQIGNRLVLVDFGNVSCCWG